MAHRRMFSKLITNTDKFLDMPSEAQVLYFHLGMEADDDGFVANPKTVMKLVNVGDDAIKLLTVKGYIIPFENGVIVIADWKENNFIKNDRKHHTIYQNELKQLKLIGNQYNLDTNWNQVGSKLEPEDRLGKDRIINKDMSANADVSSNKQQDLTIINEIISFYSSKIRPCRVTSALKQNLVSCLKTFTKEQLLQVIENKSYDKWFMTNQVWRGATWFFGNKKRIARYLDEHND